jgi:transcriptional regulator with GAF, ATPase, and Fis domain
MPTSHSDSPVPAAPRDIQQQQDRSRLLPDLNQYLLAHSDIRESFSGISRRLQRALPHRYAGLALYEPDSGQLRLYTQYIPPGGPALPTGFTLPLDGTPAGEAYRLRRPIVVDDLRSPQFICETTQELLKYGLRSGCWVPLQTANSVFGTLWISNGHPGAYRADDAYLLNDAAAQISLALANQLALQQLQLLRQKLDNQLHDRNRGFDKLAATDAFGVVQWEPGGRLSNSNDAFLSMVGRTRQEMQRGINCSDITPPGYHKLYENAEQELRKHGFCAPFENEYQLPDGTRVPALVSTGLLGQRQPPWVAFVVDLRDRRRMTASPAASLSVQRPPPLDQEAEDFAAKSPAMRKILRDIEQVAATDTTVLLLGETGTGKEILAHTICQLSDRRHRPFVKVNCAAIPAGLLESELFGHERGAFTGAQNRKIGRLELANQGTLFLDEVGDIPLELQPKLLRVLQEREFERLGSTQTIKVDVRLITATNRDLTEMVAANQFRRDLFYRLNVFPVHVPALRERPESIAVLVEYFLQKFARRLNRPALAILPSTLAALERWQWPGNIRELENLIERGVILSPGPELHVNLEELRTPLQAVLPEGQTLRDVDRDYISRVLHDTNGVVGGKHGAASRLGLKRTTLQYKMKKLEIPRH